MLLARREWKWRLALHVCMKIYEDFSCGIISAFTIICICVLYVYLEFCICYNWEKTFLPTIILLFIYLGLGCLVWWLDKWEIRLVSVLLGLNLIELDTKWRKKSSIIHYNFVNIWDEDQGKQSYGKAEERILLHEKHEIVPIVLICLHTQTYLFLCIQSRHSEINAYEK